MSHSGGPSPNGRRDLESFAQRWERAPQPVGLAPDVIDQTGVRREGKPTRVRADVPVFYSYPGTLSTVADVVAWTDRAVLLSVVIPPVETPRLVWVWANAVERI